MTWLVSCYNGLPSRVPYQTETETEKWAIIFAIHQERICTIAESQTAAYCTYQSDRSSWSRHPGDLRQGIDLHIVHSTQSRDLGLSGLYLCCRSAAVARARPAGIFACGVTFWLRALAPLLIVDDGLKGHITLREVMWQARKLVVWWCDGAEGDICYAGLWCYAAEFCWAGPIPWGTERTSFWPFCVCHVLLFCYCCCCFDTLVTVFSVFAIDQVPDLHWSGT